MRVWEFFSKVSAIAFLIKKRTVGGWVKFSGKYFYRVVPSTLVQQQSAWFHILQNRSRNLLERSGWFNFLRDSRILSIKSLKVSRSQQYETRSFWLLVGVIIFYLSRIVWQIIPEAKLQNNSFFRKQKISENTSLLLCYITTCLSNIIFIIIYHFSLNVVRSVA